MNTRRPLHHALLAIALATACGSLVLGAEGSPAAEADYWAPAPNATPAPGASSPPVSVVLCQPDTSGPAPEMIPGHTTNEAGVTMAAGPHGDALCAACNRHLEPPFGAANRATMAAQVAKGEAALMVLHHYDFAAGGAQLNYRGQQRLLKIALRSQRNPFPIIIEGTRHDPQLDSDRYASVVSQLALLPVPIPAQRVVIAPSPARPMDGVDAEIVHQNLLNRMYSGGDAVNSTAVPTGPTGTGDPSR